MNGNLILFMAIDMLRIAIADGQELPVNGTGQDLRVFVRITPVEVRESACG